jgi:hypothetical protein
MTRRLARLIVSLAAVVSLLGIVGTVFASPASAGAICRTRTWLC